eukprot:589621-Pleurochrysis_carterae.AAC.3
MPNGDSAAYDATRCRKRTERWAGVHRKSKIKIWLGIFGEVAATNQATHLERGVETKAKSTKSSQKVKNERAQARV